MKFFPAVFRYCIMLLPVYPACKEINKDSDKTVTAPVLKKGTYGYDRAFLKKNTRRLVELRSADHKSRIFLSGDYQGRVMTSTANGDSGISFGWLNYDLISSSVKRKQFNPVGGEERFWMGPEGGQYSIYFGGTDSFTFNNWQVPSFLDTDSFSISHESDSTVTFRKDVSTTSYSGTRFILNIERMITMLDRKQVSAEAGFEIPDSVGFVGYRTANKITNTGDQDWVKDKGLLSVWLLGMFTPTPSTLVIIPFKNMPGARKFITDDYFGRIPPERLIVKDSVLVFTCDGRYRSKIGIAPDIAKPIAAGFDFRYNSLTIVLPEIHPDLPYVNSKWEIQKNPYKGDVINSYNDGPLEDGSQMGPFYEIESSSPALALKIGESSVYAQTTLHLQGSYAVMRQIVLQLTGLNLDTIKR